MDLHHRLRRDPSWHPNACNICGQLGHQARDCTSGTVDWRGMYGEDAFRLKKAVFQSDIDALKKARQINFAELERRAKEYAKMRTEAAGKSYDELGKKAQQMLAEGQAAAGPEAGGTAAAAAAAAPEEKKEEEKKEDAMPEGWAVAYDAQKRPYYWHTVTKKVQWERPTKDTPTGKAAEGVMRLI